MSRATKRKTNNAVISEDIMQGVAETVANVFQTEKLQGTTKFNRNTLKRFIDRKASEANIFIAMVPSGLSVQSSAMKFKVIWQTKWRNHQRFHNLASRKRHRLAYKLVLQNNIRLLCLTFEWIRNFMENIANFMTRYNISLWFPEATSMARTTAFNKHTVQAFFPT